MMYEQGGHQSDDERVARQRERLELDADTARHIAASAVRVSVGQDGSIVYSNLPHGGYISEQPDGTIITASMSPSGSVGFGFMEPLEERPQEFPEA